MVARATKRPIGARRRIAIGLATVCGLLAVGSCSGSEAQSSPISQGDHGSSIDSAAATSAPPSTSEEPATTDAMSTQAPSTEVAMTIADTTTTAAPVPVTTVAAATTTSPPPPNNKVPIAATSPPLAAVGGQSGPETARVQQRLLDLGFWVSEVDGSYGLTTSQAVMAFQKYFGLDASGSVDEPTAAFMSGVTERPFGLADSGTLVEIDKTRQLLMFVVDGRVKWVFNTSTGNGEEYLEEDQNSPGTLVEGVSLTPDGFHEVSRERPVGWWEGDLGKIYRPKYFVGGVAVHGSSSVPNYPASHGCVRVTVEAMDFIWDTGLMPLRLPVWVHQGPRA